MVAGEERWSKGHVELRWDPHRRLVRFRQHPGTYDAALAREVQAVMERWVRADEPFRILVDTTGVTELGPGWRSSWLSWFGRGHRGARIALFGTTDLPATTLPVFAFASGLDMRVFDSESEALAWLQAPKEL